MNLLGLDMEDCYQEIEHIYHRGIFINFLELDIKDCYKEVFKSCHDEAINQLVPLTKGLKDPKHRTQLQDIQGIFSLSVMWQHQGRKDGNEKYFHRLTGIVVEYPAHIKDKEIELSPKIQSQLAYNIQEHLNLLCHHVISYISYNWKKKSDNDSSYKNWLLITKKE